VVRIRKGEQVWLFDEKGCEYLAMVDRVAPEQTRLHILEQYDASEQGIRFILAMSMLKARSWEWVLQKGTEMGLDAFVPILSARCVVRIPPGAEKGKLERWARITRAAAKQSGRSRLPEISKPLLLREFLNCMPIPNGIVLMEDAAVLLRDLVLARFQQKAERPEGQREIFLLVGPEGGWTKREADDILRQGFEAVSLGDNILRAETAAICSLAVLIQFWKK
jgi:16S rRNA (uracil1498-N3)-methyltransferase